MRCGTGATINGGKKLPQDHVQKTKTLLESLLHDTMSLLIMPTLTRGRHRFTTHGRKLALQYVTPVKYLQLQIINTIRQLHDQVEVMKACGMPANEASRINQYHWLLQARIEKLQNIKVCDACVCCLASFFDSLYDIVCLFSVTARLKLRAPSLGFSSWYFPYFTAPTTFTSRGQRVSGDELRLLLAAQRINEFVDDRHLQRGESDGGSVCW